ncbi:lipopolysaccharide heptosyltransferase II [bacterium]|nr:lipopolysaccharide heptosyltransferase II [bacterium]
MLYGGAPKKILLIQTAFLGDVVLATALQRRLSEAFPEAEIHWLVRPDAEAIVAPLVPFGRVLVYAKRAEARGPGGFFRMARILEEREFDAAVAVQRSFRTAALLWQAGIPLRIGFAGAGGWFFYNRRVPHQGRHARDRMVRLVEGFGVSAADPPEPYLRVATDAREAVLARLAAAGVGSRERLVILAPGSAWRTKQWPARYFGRVAGDLLAKGFDRGIVVGGGGDGMLAAEVADAAGEGSSRILDWTGKTTAAELVATIAHAQFCIANDSAPGHIAGAVDTPLVAIFGPTTPEMGFVPLGRWVTIAGHQALACRPCSRHGSMHCPVGTHACMEELDPVGVSRVALQLDSETGSRGV